MDQDAAHELNAADSDVVTAVAQKLKEIREARRVPQHGLAERLSVSPKTVGRWENGRLPRRPGIALWELASALETDLALVVEEVTERPSSNGKDAALSQSGFVRQVDLMIGELSDAVAERRELTADFKTMLILNLRYLRNQLVGLERPDAPIPEQIALLYSDLREIRSIAPEWIGDRIGAMFADKTFALALGSAVGSVLVAALK